MSRSLVLLVVVAVLSGGFLLATPPPADDRAKVWAFAPTHAAAFRDVPGDHAVSLMHVRALDTRLTTLALAGEAGPAVVELEVNSAPKHVPSGRLLPLTDRLRAAGVLDRLPATSRAAWSHDGELYAVPQDVHPVTLVYRADLFAEAGVDPAAAATWAEMVDVLRAYRRHHGSTPLELPRAGASHAAMMLLQRGLQVTGHDDPRAAVVFDTYATLLNEALAADATAGPVGWVNDLADGVRAMQFMPDWRVAYLDARPDLAGKLRMIPLPVFEAGDARTSVWGGTALAVPADAADPDAAFGLLMRLSFGDDALAARRRHTHILPADPATWPTYDEPHELFAGQRVGAVYADLADEVPTRVVGPDTAAAGAAVAAQVAALRASRK